MELTGDKVLTYTLAYSFQFSKVHSQVTKKKKKKHLTLILEQYQIIVCREKKKKHYPEREPFPQAVSL